MANRARPTGARRHAESKRKQGLSRRAQRSSILLRWCVVGLLGLVAFLYYRPLASYVETRATLNERQGEVQRLRAERTHLQARLERSASLAALGREARRNDFVRPGERLFIVKGIPEWRRAHRATIRRDG